MILTAYPRTSLPDLERDKMKLTATLLAVLLLTGCSHKPEHSIHMPFDAEWRQPDVNPADDFDAVYTSNVGKLSLKTTAEKRKASNGKIIVHVYYRSSDGNETNGIAVSYRKSEDSQSDGMTSSEQLIQQAMQESLRDLYGVQYSLIGEPIVKPVVTEGKDDKVYCWVLSDSRVYYAMPIIERKSLKDLVSFDFLTGLIVWMR